jgi:hypothetical protein
MLKNTKLKKHQFFYDKMKGLIFHTLKGKLGWSYLKIIHIDVYTPFPLSNADLYIAFRQSRNT